MRVLAKTLIAAALVFFFPASGPAQQKGPIRIEQIRVGLSSAGVLPAFKAGAWTPIIVDVRAGPQPTPRGEIVIDSADSDDVHNRYTVPLPPLQADEAISVMGYTRPGSSSAEITVSVKIDDRMAAAPHQDTYSAID